MAILSFGVRISRALAPSTGHALLCRDWVPGCIRGGRQKLAVHRGVLRLDGRTPALALGSGWVRTRMQEIRHRRRSFGGFIIVEFAQIS